MGQLFAMGDHERIKEFRFHPLYSEMWAHELTGTLSTPSLKGLLRRMSSAFGVPFPPSYQHSRFMSEAVLYCRAVKSGHLSHRTILLKALRLAGHLKDRLALLGFLGSCPLLAQLMAPHYKPSAPSCPLLTLQVAPDIRCLKNRDAFHELDVRHTLL
jgi:hypothetical protein